MSELSPTLPDLDGKSVAVTGGASGIGESIVRQFHAQNSRVVFFDIDAQAGEALALEMGDGVSFVELDLTDLHALQKSFAQASKASNGFDILVNNAAHDDRHEIADVTPEYWRERLAVNLDHQFFTAQAVIPAMREKGAGVIINMSSIAWRIGIEKAPAYVAAKAAIEGLTHALARELGPAGIRVNSVLPGFVKTQRQTEKWLTPELHATVMSAQCLKSFIHPDDIAAAVVFVGSDMARAITNQSIIVDAGWS